MTALKVMGCILPFLLLAGFLRVGAVVFLGSAPRVLLRVGALRVPLVPRKKRAAKKPKGSVREKPSKEKAAKKQGGKRAGLPRPSPDELLELARTALSALGATLRRACGRVRVDPLDVTVVIGGDDPANAAILYGAACGAMYALMPRAEACFHVPAPSLRLRMGYGAEGPSGGTSCEGSIGLSLRVCDLFAIAFTLAAPLLGWFLRFKRAHRHDGPAHRGPPKEAKADDTEEKIARKGAGR